MDRRISLCWSGSLKLNFSIWWALLSAMLPHSYSCTATLSEARTMLPEGSSRPLPAKTAHSRNLALASLETTVCLLADQQLFKEHNGL